MSSVLKIPVPSRADEPQLPAVETRRAAPTPPAGPAAGTSPLPAIALAIAAILLLYGETALSMVHIWARSETFAHGFLVAPISLWLVWRQRRSLQGLTLQPSLTGYALLGACGLGWLVARYTSIAVLQQFFLIGSLTASVLALLGWQGVKRLAFPLAFLFFAVPVGEALIEPLMHFTAEFSVRMLRLSGIAVFQEGTFITIPTGQWSVVEGCSGLRYLIASITLGVLYAYLTYRSLWRRIAFILLSICAPIIANGFRAYMIIMIGHLSDMRLATGVDHILYGWVFFGIVMLFLFWAGSFWREDDTTPAAAQAEPVAPRRPVSLPLRIIAPLAVVALSAVWPAWARLSDQGLEDSMQDTVPLLPGEAAGWRAVEGPIADWRPRFVGADVELARVYERDGVRVGVHVAYYRYSRQGAELVNSQNYMIRQKHPVWKQVRKEPMATGLESPGQVLRSELASPDQRLAIWHWYWMGGRHIVDDRYAKLIEARNRLVHGDTRGYGLVIYAEDTGDLTVDDSLREFTAAVLPLIEPALLGLPESGMQSAAETREAR